MEKLNNLNGGWYLPYIQRQYVWGPRYESEEYVCLLLDSLMKRYPIGGLVLWETSRQVSYGEFLNDYEPGKFTRQVEEGRWGAHKFLVYDGQQRLQTLRSVLYYTFNGRALHFDLLFETDKDHSDETGFLFRDKDKPADPRYLKLTQLVSTPCDPREKVELEYRLLERLRQTHTIDMPTEILVRSNLAALWDIFVDTNEKSIAYFPVKAEDEAPVNEVFRRLNTGGIALTEVEQVLGEIKKRDQGYEEKLWRLSEEIRSRTNGIEFSSAQVLQFFHLLEKETTRVHAPRFTADDAERFLAALAHQDALIELFEGYLWGLFKINNASIVPRWRAVLPLAVYLTTLKRTGREWRVRALTADQVLAMHTYFLSAQFCDWNTQTMVNAFAARAARAGANGEVLPVEAFRQTAIERNRTGLFSAQQFLALPGFALKVLTPSRDYVFHDNKPQLDHIFPLGLAGAGTDYVELVDVLWNLQPIPDGINNFKRARNPKEFFNSTDGTKYWQEYDFIPERNSPIWDDPARFIQYREGQMRQALRERYRFELEPAGSAE
ncbi:MAG: DUF262 domain-containing protein [Candidatus Binataceae bacterium]